MKVTNKNSSHQELSRVELRYDANDKLIGRKVFLSGSSIPSEQQVFVYENGQVVFQFEKTGSGSMSIDHLSHRYLWGPAVDQLLADEVVNDPWGEDVEVHWALADHLGTVRDWIDNSAAVLDHAEYDSFGRRLDAAVVDAAFGWTGRYRDPLTGLQFNDARWYNPEIGRWLSEDPIGFAAGDANLYRYVGNAPTSFLDPEGMRQTPVRPVQRPLPIGTPGTGGTPGPGPAPGPGPGITGPDWPPPNDPAWQIPGVLPRPGERGPGPHPCELRSLDPDPVLPFDMGIPYEDWRNAIKNRPTRFGVSPEEEKECEEDYDQCWRDCWNSMPPWPYEYHRSSHYRYCDKHCFDEYWDCIHGK